MAKNRTRSAATQDRARLLNQLTALFLGLSLIVLLCDALIFFIPQINPIAAWRPIQAAQLPTSGPTSTPTITPTPTRTPRPTNTPTFTASPSPTPGVSPSVPLTGTRRGATPTLTLTPTPAGTPTPTLSPFNYTAELIYQRAQLYGTNWAGIAGLVLGVDRKHQPNIDVHVWGDPPLGPQGQTIASGTHIQYGPSGWEFTLGDKPAFGKWNVQLVGPDGTPLSPIVEVEMQGDPRANLAYVIFLQNH